MTAGIYKIINKINKKYYLGSSQNIEKRWKQHQNSLDNNHHINNFLQNAWLKYGKDNFYIEIIMNYDGYSRDELFNMEQVYLNNLDEYSYNLSKVATGGDIISYHPNRNEIVAKISISMKKRYELMTDEDWENFSRSKSGAKNGMFGKNHTEASKEEISKNISKYYLDHNSYRLGKSFEELFGEEIAQVMKKSMSEIASKKIGDKNPFYGKNHTEEVKNKISNSHKDKYFGNQNIPILINDVIYQSLGEASEKLNIPITTIRWRVLSKNKKFINYKYNDRN